MCAARFLGNREAVVVDVPLPEPGPGEVRVEMRAAAVCGSDLHRYRRPPADPPSTTIPGHEPVGLLRSLGDGVTGLEPGTWVVVYHRRGCGRCAYCIDGDVMLCPNGQRAHGFACAGADADADYMVTDARCLLPLPSRFSDEEGAILACNAGTAYAPLRRLGVSGRDMLAVSGLGPVGLCAVLLGRAMGARVIGVDPAPERRALAERLGAVATVDPRAGPPGAALRQIAARSADALMETSGSPAGHAAIIELLDDDPAGAGTAPRHRRPRRHRRAAGHRRAGGHSRYGRRPPGHQRLRPDPEAAQPGRLEPLSHRPVG